MNYKNLISTYESDVQFPDVSGMEHLDMLLTRSEIAKHSLHLSDEDRQRVQKADLYLLQNVEQFYKSIQAVADIAAWRREENVSTSQWWWFLDVIAQLPAKVSISPEMKQSDYEPS